MPVTVRKLQDAKWVECYHYDYSQSGCFFKTFSSDIEGVTVTHDRKIGSKRTMIYYTVRGRRTDSPSEAVKIWNRHEKENGAQA